MPPPANGGTRCWNCGVTESPSWRNIAGATPGNEKLCNACGLYYSKLMARQRKERENQQGEASRHPKNAAVGSVVCHQTPRRERAMAMLAHQKLVAASESKLTVESLAANPTKLLSAVIDSRMDNLDNLVDEALCNPLTLSLPALNPVGDYLDSGLLPAINCLPYASLSSGTQPVLPISHGIKPEYGLDQKSKVI